MSLLRPVGPLAPHVYWLRRIMVLAAAALIVFGGTKLVGSLTAEDRVEAAGKSEPTALPEETLSAPEDESAGPGGGSGPGGGAAGGDSGGADSSDSSDSSGSGERGGRSGTDGSGTEGDGAGGDGADSDSGSGNPGGENSGDGSGDVDATNVSNDLGPAERARSLPICLTEDIRVSAKTSESEAEVGSDLRLTAVLANETDSPCRVEVNPISLQIQVVSGADRVWTSAHCPVLIPTGPLTLEPGEPRPMSVDWPGTRSGPECAEDQPEAPAGYYEVRATLGDLVSAPERLRIS